MKRELTIRFEPEERKLLQSFADEHGLSLAAALRLIVRGYLRQSQRLEQRAGLLGAKTKKNARRK